MMHSHNNSRLELPKRRLLTSESQPRDIGLQKMHSSKCTQPLIKGDRVVALINNTMLARSTNSFQLPQMAQIQKQNMIFKCRAAHALFAKHKKRMESIHKEKRNQICASNCSSLPNGINRILKAKSTVIKQNKLQQFYISIGEIEQQKIVSFQSQNIKSNFLRPNFSKKKTKIKRQSLIIEKPLKHIQDQLLQGTEIGQKIDLFSQKWNEKDCVLKQRSIVDNRQKATHQKRLIKNMSQIHKDKSELEEKQNMEFNLQPWNNPDDEPFF